MRNAPRLAPLITAMGMSLLLQTLAMIIWKPNPKPYPLLLPTDPIDLGGPSSAVTQCLILGLTAAILAALMYLVNKTKLGLAMRATAENPRVAALMGVRQYVTERVKRTEPPVPRFMAIAVLPSVRLLAIS